MGMELLAAVVRDAWRQCRRRPLAVVAGVVLIGGSPGFPPQSTGRELEVGGWLGAALLPAALALSVLWLLAMLFLVAYLAGALRPELARAARALRRTRDSWPAGILALVIVSAVSTFPAQLAAALFQTLAGDTSPDVGLPDPPSAPWDGLALRLLPIWPVAALGPAVLALLTPRIVVDGDRDVQRAVAASVRVARRTFPICLLIGLLQAGGQVIRGGSSLGVMLAVAAAAGLGAVFAMAMANALLWHTRSLQIDPDRQFREPEHPQADRGPVAP
jgi:hypothetical protein